MKGKVKFFMKLKTVNLVRLLIEEASLIIYFKEIIVLYCTIKINRQINRNY